MEPAPRENWERLRDFSVSQISDALGFLYPVEASLRPVDPASKICGGAFTVLCEPDDNLAVVYALSQAQKGDVLVISSPGPSGAAIWGEVLSLAAQTKGIAGVIVDGAIRDMLEIKAMAYPVFFRSTNARRARKEKQGEYNIPVRCGSIVVRPGETIFADRDGLLAFPPSRIEEVLAIAIEITQRESEIKRQVSLGVDIADILRVPRDTAKTES